MQRTLSGFLLGIFLVGPSGPGCQSSGSDAPVDSSETRDGSSSGPEPDLRGDDPRPDLAAPYPSGPPEVIKTGLTELVTSTAVAISAAGRAQIAYSTATGIYFLRELDTGWESATVLAGGQPFAPLSLVLHKDLPWVSYQDLTGTTRRVQVASPGVMGWSIETVADQLVSGSTGGAPIVVDPSDKLTVFSPQLYSKPMGYEIYTVFAQRSGPMWQFGGFLGNGTPHGLVLDPRGQLSMVYTNSALTVSAYLGYARQEGIRWYLHQIKTVMTAGPARLAIDSLNHPHIIYCDNGANQVNYAYSESNGGGWQINPLEPTRSEYVGIGIAPGDVPVVAYYHEGKLATHLARRTGGRWRLQTVDQGADVGRALSLAMDRAGRAHIIYYDATNKTLKRAIR